MKYDKIVTFGCSYSECLNNSDSSVDNWNYPGSAEPFRKHRKIDGTGHWDVGPFSIQRGTSLNKDSKSFINFCKNNNFIEFSKNNFFIDSWAANEGFSTRNDPHLNSKGHNRVAEIMLGKLNNA
jgi:hypothetical protein